MNIVLQGAYIQVKRKNTGEITFGGDQNFFGGIGAGSEDARKKGSGCGVVAFSDVLLYLAGRNRQYQTAATENYVNRILEEEEYKAYYNSVFAFLDKIPSKNGVSGLKLWLKFNKIARENHWDLRAGWGMSGRKIHGRMEEMLQKDIPVILCIPMMLRKKDKSHRLNLYKREQDGEYRSVQSINAHYVTVTGIIREQENVWMECSSWGNKYYVSRNEYDTFIHNHFMGTILGNILYIRQT